MAKKEAAKKQEQQESDGAGTELVALAAATTDLELGQAMLVDKLKQAKSENQQLLEQIETLKARITNSTQDYVDILQHREEQNKASDARTSILQQQLDRLHADLTQAAKETAALKEVNNAQAARLDDAAALLTDKDRLEDMVKKQHALIEQRGQEIKVTRAQLDSKEVALSRARDEIDELSLRCQASTRLHVLFGEPWLVETKLVKLKGAIPFDREYNTLCCTAGGKQLVLFGGHSRTHESVGRETAVLSLDSLVWEVPETALQPSSLLGHSCCVVGRNKLLLLGGSNGEEATAAAQVAQQVTDSMKWSSVSPSGVVVPPARLCHAATTLNDKAYVFGGMTSDGHLLNDLWVLDMDSMQWHQLHTFGTTPSPRKGSSLCATEDGRRLVLFGGHDGATHLNDCWFLEVQQLLWTGPITAAGTPPEPREGHTAAVLGKFMFITGGCGGGSGSFAAAEAAAAGTSTAPAAAGSQQAAGSGSEASSVGHGSAPLAAAGGAAAEAGGNSGAAGDAAAGACRRLCDTHVLDLFSGPAWEQLCDGASASTMWLKQMSVSSVMRGNRLLTLQPNLHEQLDQMQVMTLTLPDDIERMKTAKRREQEQVDRLELGNDAACSSSSIEVRWRPPSKSKDRITGYKLMLSTSTGVVREVYSGRATSHTCTGLRPAAEYVVCVKCTYDDNSFLWSESKAYHTTML